MTKEIFTIVGIEDVDYVSKKTNSRVTGTRLYVSLPIEKNGEGVRTSDVYISDKVLEELDFELHVSQEIEFAYNKYGNVIGIFQV